MVAGPAQDPGSRPRPVGAALRRWRWGIVVLIAGLGVAVWLLSRAHNAAPRESAAPSEGQRPAAASAAAPSVPPSQPPKPDPLDEGSISKERFEAARQLVADFPGDAEAHMFLALIYRMQDDMAAARKHLERALELDPDQKALYNDLGLLLVDQGEYEEALAMFRKGIQKVPNAARLHFDEGQTLMRLGRYAEAVEALQQAVRFGPDSSEYGSTLGEAYLKLKDYEKARQAGEAAVKVRPVFFKAYWILASAYAGLGQEAKALECRQRFGELDTQHRERQWRTAANDAEMAVSNTTFTHTGIGRVYRRLGRPEKARELWHRAAVLRPRDLPSRLELAGLDMELGQYPEVLALSEEITRIDPHSPFGPLFAGHAYAALRRADEAEAAYRKAMDLAPALPDGYAGLARLRLKTGRDLAEAKLLASTAVQLAPLPQNLAVLGEACGRNGDLQGARAAYERALKLAPGNPEIRKAYEELARRP